MSTSSLQRCYISIVLGKDVRIFIRSAVTANPKKERLECIIHRQSTTTCVTHQRVNDIESWHTRRNSSVHIRNELSTRPRSYKKKSQIPLKVKTKNILATHTSVSAQRNKYNFRPRLQQCPAFATVESALFSPDSHVPTLSTFYTAVIYTPKPNQTQRVR